MRVLEGPTELASFAYDGFGRRAEKNVAGTTRRYVYSGDDILEERVGSTTSPHVHGPGIDQPLAPLATVTASDVAYYLADHLGSIVQTTNAAAAVTLPRQYDPYGRPLAGGTTSGYAFTGREWDAETSSYYYRARHHRDAGGKASGDADLTMEDAREKQKEWQEQGKPRSGNKGKHRPPKGGWWTPRLPAILIVSPCILEPRLCGPPVACGGPV